MTVASDGFCTGRYWASATVQAVSASATTMTKLRKILMPGIMPPCNELDLIRGKLIIASTFRAESLISKVRSMETKVEGSLSDCESYYTGISTANTVFPRYIAAMTDNAVAMVLAIVGAKLVDDDKPILQAVVLTAVYLSYYFAFELLLSRTPG